MPIDRYGRPLKEGDEVVLRARITTCLEGDAGSNLGLEVIDFSGIGGLAPPKLSCNSRLVEQNNPARGAPKPAEPGPPAGP